MKRRNMLFDTGTTAGRYRARRRHGLVSWEDGKFIGAVVLAWGANRHLAGEYKLKMTECAELCRIALDRHVTPVSRIISIAVKMLKREMPGIRLLVSYADPNQGHEGKIYQASNWLFVGMTGQE